MKPISVLLAVYFLVQWSEFEAKYHSGGCNKIGCLVMHYSGCTLIDEPKNEKFPTKEEAKKFVEENKDDKKKHDFKILRVEEKELP